MTMPPAHLNRGPRPVRPCKTPSPSCRRQGRVAGTITAIIGVDKFLRGYLITGTLSTNAIDYLRAAHPGSDFIWTAAFGRQWGVPLVFARRSWIESQRCNTPIPAGITITFQK